MNPPFFDRFRIYDIAWLHHHTIQKQFALFVSKPELYADIGEIPESDKQDYLFYSFQKMLSKYYHLNIEKQYDESAYFGSLSQDKVGAANICGGSDNKTRSARASRIGGYKAAQANRSAKMDYLAKKYGLAFKGGADPRLFLGHAEPWKTLSPALLEKEGWGWVAEQSYSDETFHAPFPEKIDGDLIPLAIRNKVLQKWRAKRNATSTRISCIDEESEENPGAIQPPELPKTEPIMSVFSEEEMKLILEEGW
jgi:hypothetical protein